MRLYSKFILSIVASLSYTACNLSAQPVNIQYTGIIAESTMRLYYDSIFGANNVNFQTVSELSGFENYDIIIINNIDNNYPANNLIELQNFIANGGHVVLSTEGCVFQNTTDKIMSTLWNNVTGQSITETQSWAAGTASPPRFHNSLGPWHSSPDLVLNNSTTSYASFGNMNPLNVSHQRSLLPSSCENTEGVNAMYPAYPAVGDGTLYISGEVQYPFSASQWGDQTNRNHLKAIITMQKALLDGDTELISELNTWEGNLNMETDFLPEDIVLCDEVNFVIEHDFLADTYDWNTGETTQNITVSESGVYYVYATRDGACDGLDSMSVQFTNSIDLLGSDTSTCMNPEGITLMLPLEYPNGEWSTGESGPTTTVTESGEYSVEVINDSGCPLRDTINIEFLNGEGNHVLPEDTILCALDNFSLSIDEGQSFEWSTGESTAAVNINEPGVYWVNVLQENGCYAKDTIEVTEFLLPNISFNVEDVCIGDYVNISANIFMLDQFPETQASFFEWSLSNGEVTNSEEFNYLFFETGSYDLELSITTAAGCTLDALNTFLVHDVPTPYIEAEGACTGDAPVLVKEKSISTDGDIVNYNWSVNGISINGPSSFSYDFVNPGLQNIELMVNTEYGCTSSTELEIEILQSPSVSFELSEYSGCAPFCTQITGISANSPTSELTFNWDYSGVNLDSNLSLCYSSPGEKTISVMIENLDGCKTTSSKIVEVYDSPQAQINVYPGTVVKGEFDFEFTTDVFDDVIGTTWVIGNEIITSDPFESINYNFKDSGMYEVSLYLVNSMGCTNEIKEQIRIIPNQTFWLPNAFTPNGDGMNDSFGPMFTNVEVDNYSLEIFNRWGKTVYSSSSLEENWNGEFEGNLAEQGVYNYKSFVTINEENRSYEGPVYLVR